MVQQHRETVLSTLVLVSRRAVKDMPGSMVCIPQYTTIGGNGMFLEAEWKIVCEPTSGHWTNSMATVCRKPDGLLHCFFYDLDISSAKRRYQAMVDRGFGLKLDTWSIHMSAEDQDLLEFTSPPPEYIKEQLALSFNSKATRNSDWLTWRDSIKTLLEHKWNPPLVNMNSCL